MELGNDIIGYEGTSRLAEVLGKCELPANIDQFNDRIQDEAVEILWHKGWVKGPGDPWTCRDFVIVCEKL